MSHNHNSTMSNGGNMNNSASNNTENSKKEEFRRYLDKTGVMDALTKVLVGLYEEPDRSHINALEYVKKYLNAPAGGVDVDGLKRDLESLKRENDELKRQLEKVKKQSTGSE